MDVFIVLSGFCLIIPVARAGRLRGGAMGFFARRYRRILPPFYAAIVLSFLIPALVLRPGHIFSNLSPKMLWANLLLLQDVCASDTVNAVLWSVALECKIYLLFPLLAWLLLKRGPALTLAASALIGYGLAFASASKGIPLQEAYSWYLFLFAMGLTAGWLAFKPVPKGEQLPDGRPSPRLRNEMTSMILTGGAVVLAVALLLRLGIVTNSAYRHMPLIDGGLGVLTALLLMSLAAWPDRWRLLHRVLNWRPMVFIGTFAYSVYLIHVPLQLIQAHLLRTFPVQHTAVGHFVTYAVGIPFVVGMAFLFFLAFERPFLNSRRRETLRQTAQEAIVSPAP